MKFSFEFLYSFGPTHARKIETEMILTAFNNYTQIVEDAARKSMPSILHDNQ